MSDMRTTGRAGRTRRLGWLALAVAALVASAPIARAAVSAGLTPSSQMVTPGTDFDLFFDVTAAGSQFNGFDVVVSYNPAALTFLPLAPTSLQQGCLMTGGCSAACGNTFHLFSAAADSLSASDVLLCDQTFLTGPGHLYKLRFHASSTEAELVEMAGAGEEGLVISTSSASTPRARCRSRTSSSAARTSTTPACS